MSTVEKLKCEICGKIDPRLCDCHAIWVCEECKKPFCNMCLDTWNDKNHPGYDGSEEPGTKCPNCKAINSCIEPEMIQWGV